MSRGGKHAQQSQTGVRAIASALGIARHEIGAFTKIKKEAPQLYPPFNATVHVPKSERDNYDFLSKVHREIRTKYKELETYDPDAVKNDVKHFTDDYKKVKIADTPVTFYFNRMPAELNFEKKQRELRAKKRKMIDEESVARKLQELEEKERKAVVVLNEGESDDNEEEEDTRRVEDDEEQLSDEDYQEEDNDYIQSYFDNGEGYGEGMSDDNLDDDGGY
uniref:DNA-directed RNA polymerase III subunit n=1 Tax=Steinernema glaseri TaxID=37863 RepID=A0A1I7ZDP1_9BILA